MALVITFKLGKDGYLDVIKMETLSVDCQMDKKYVVIHRKKTKKLKKGYPNKGDLF